MSQTSGLSTDMDADMGTTFPALARVVPAGIGQRAVARALDLLVGAAAVGGLLVIALLGPDPSDEQAVLVYSVVVRVLALALVLTVLTVFALTGLLPGGAFTGLRQVRVDTGGPPGAAGVAKYALLALLTLVTVGLGYLVTVITVPRDPWHRSWVDRRLGLIVLDIRQGRDPRHEPVGDPLVNEMVPLESLAGRHDAARPSSPAPAVRPDPAPPPVAVAPQAPAVEQAPVIEQPPAGEHQAPVVEDSTAAGRSGTDPAPAPGSTTQINPRIGAQVRPVRVRLPDGSTVLIDRPTAFGRNPVRPPGRPDVRLVQVADPQRSVSKTHAVLTPQPGGVLVEDLRSTNGTSILTDRGHVVVPAGVRLAARVGWQIGLADFVLTVEDA